MVDEWRSRWTAVTEAVSPVAVRLRCGRTANRTRPGRLYERPTEHTERVIDGCRRVAAGSPVSESEQKSDSNTA